MWKETFRGFVLEGKLHETEIEVVAKLFIYGMHGMLTLCLSNNGELTEEIVYQDLGKMVDYLLKWSKGAKTNWYGGWYINENSDNLWFVFWPYRANSNCH